MDGLMAIVPLHRPSSGRCGRAGNADGKRAAGRRDGAQLVLPGDNPDVAGLVLEHDSGAISTLTASYTSASEFYMMNGAPGPCHRRGADWRGRLSGRRRFAGAASNLAGLQNDKSKSAPNRVPHVAGSFRSDSTSGQTGRTTNAQ
jgi:hypothetical protein